MSKDKRKKEKYVDDGHTIYNMNVEGMRGYKKQNDNSYYDKDDKRALVKAALLAYLPKLLIVILGFTLALILIYFWLK